MANVGSIAKERIEKTLTVGIVGVLVLALGAVSIFVLVVEGTVGQWFRAQAIAAASCNTPVSANTNGVTVDTLNQDQVQNAQIIINTGAQRGIPQRGLVVAIATAMQESTLKNINYGDRDSLGLFQQRPSQGWGTPAQVTDPVYSSNKFYDGLVKVPNWEQLPVTVAAQKVQRSGFPDAYAKWETLAVTTVQKLLPNAPQGGALPSGGGAPNAQLASFNTGAGGCMQDGAAAGSNVPVAAGSWVLPARGRFTSPFGMRDGRPHEGVDIAPPTPGQTGQPIYAAADGVVRYETAGAFESGKGLGGFGHGIIITHDVGGKKIETLYGHLNRVDVRAGQQVKAGQVLGEMGNTGASQGVHLHFEVHDVATGGKINPETFMKERGVDLRAQTQTAAPAAGAQPAAA